MQEQKRLQWIQVLAILAIIVSAYLTYLHYSPAKSTFCVLGEGFDCNIVNQSPYAKFDGIFFFMFFDMGLPVPLIDIPIPNAIVSIVVFLFVYGAARSLMKKQAFLGMKRKGTLTFLRILLYLSIIYAIYLVYIEAFILYNYCIFCIVLDILIIAIMWLLVGLRKPKAAQQQRKPARRVTKTVKRKKKRR